MLANVPFYNYIFAHEFGPPRTSRDSYWAKEFENQHKKKSPMRLTNVTCTWLEKEKKAKTSKCVFGNFKKNNKLKQIWGGAAPSHYGPSAGALDAENPKSKRNKNGKPIGQEINDFLTDLQHIFHARSCNNFLCFPHTPKPPRPLKRAKNLKNEITFVI